MDAPTVMVGIVGDSAVVESYPLGPHLLEELEAIFGEDPNVILENFTWSPVHIVQRLQGGEMERPDRVILVGLAADTNKPGTVSAHRWIGGSQPEVMVQERIYEAVTGIVDLENTLMIGSYFKVWPTECLTVEVDLAADTFGRLVMAENGGRDSEKELERELGYSPIAVRKQMVEAVRLLVLNGIAAKDPVLKDKDADMLSPIRSFSETHVANLLGD